MGSGLRILIPLIILISNCLIPSAVNAIVSNSAKIIDPHLQIESLFKGISNPTSMAFLGKDDILVLEKNEGTVKRIVNGTMIVEPLLDVNVATKGSRGMLGIAIPKHTNGSKNYVFLYYTEAATKDGEDVSEGKDPVGNRLYRYELVNNSLVNPKLILDLPASPGSIHNGGKILIGPDNNVYLVLGDLVDFKNSTQGHNYTQAQNVHNGSLPNGSGGILRIAQDGSSIQGVIGNKPPLSEYYAYGIRNSFGMDFDPLSEKLWDTENGPAYGDEINLVQPGFNSGWNKVQGIWAPRGNNSGEVVLSPHDLVTFDGKGKYGAPKFVWYQNVAPTALKFFNSDKLGSEYENDMFVGDYINGQLYHFELNQNRTGLNLLGPLVDGVANKSEELQSIVFGSGLGRITDIQVGPDGYLYLLLYHSIHGSIAKISPENAQTSTSYKILPSPSNEIPTEVD